MKTKITRRVSFSAGHRLYNPEYSDEKNAEIFGDCSNPEGHGHNYILEVTVTGEIDQETGMLINLKEMKKIIQEEIISKVDHKNLNSQVEFMKDLIPTTENLARRIWEVLDKKFKSGMLARIILRETENNFVEISRS